MSDNDIDIFNEADGLAKQMTNKVKGLKKLKTTMTEAEKEMASIATTVDKIQKQQKRIALTNKVKALQSIGVTGSAIGPALAKLNRTPAHAAYAYLAARGAPQNLLNNIARNAGPRAQAHIAAQMPIGATSPIPTGGGPRTQAGIQAQMQAQYIQQGIDFQQKGREKGGGGSDGGSSVWNTAIPGIRTLGIAAAGAGVAVKMFTSAIHDINQSQIKTAVGVEHADTVKSNFVTATGVSRGVAESIHQTSGAAGLSYMEQTTSQATTNGPGSVRGSIALAAAALKAGAPPGMVNAAVANNDLNALRKMGQFRSIGAAGTNDQNRLDYGNLYAGKSATEVTKAVEAESMRTARESQLGWKMKVAEAVLPGLKENHEAAFVVKQYNEGNYDEQQMPQISPSNRRFGPGRQQAFPSDTGGGRVQDVNVINSPQPKPATNPYLGSGAH